MASSTNLQGCLQLILRLSDFPSFISAEFITTIKFQKGNERKFCALSSREHIAVSH